MGVTDRVERKAKERKFTRILTVFVILAGLLISGYYVFSSTVTEGAYKIYVGGKGYGENQNKVDSKKKGFGLSTLEDGKPLSNITNKGNRQAVGGIDGSSFATDTYVDYRTGVRYPGGFSYLMSVGSSHPASVETNVTDRGAAGEANGDEFYALKFFLMNTREPDPLNGDDGVIHYAIRLDITANTNNALSAARFAVMKVHDEKKIYNIETGVYDNKCFDIMVIGQPKMEKQANGDTLIYQGDEEDSQEYVAACVTGDYTNTPDTILLKNPNKGKEDEDWKCRNLRLNDKSGVNTWAYDTLEHEEVEDEQVFHLEPGETVPYVMAAWFESTDPNHNNDIQGGYVSFSFTFYEVEE